VPTFDVPRRTAAVAAAVALVALVAGSRLLAHVAGTGTPSAAPAPVRAVPVATPRAPALVVHVVGAVRRPGLYRLREGSRVADAVAKAGGATPRADLSLVNLAAPAADGTQVVVPRRAAAGGGGATAPAAPGAPAGPVQLNSATVEQLDALPGVGPVTAQKIVDYRQQNGAFRSVDDLDAIPGIGPARLEQLRELVTP
jgi:competence protein ComEA